MTGRLSWKKPALILWGLEDIAFRGMELKRWKSEFTNFELCEFGDCRLFLAEEAPEGLAIALRAFIGRRWQIARLALVVWPGTTCRVFAVFALGIEMPGADSSVPPAIGN